MEALSPVLLLAALAGVAVFTGWLLRRLGVKT
jgi:hypothetical protein